MYVEYLHARIYREEARHKATDGNYAKALVVQRGESSQHHGDKKSFACFCCKNKGQKIADCRKRLKDEESKGGNENREGSHARGVDDTVR